MNFREYTEVEVECVGDFDYLQVRGLYTDECKRTINTPYFPPEFNVLTVKYGHVEVTDIVDMQVVLEKSLNELN